MDLGRRRAARGARRAARGDGEYLQLVKENFVSEFVGEARLDRIDAGVAELDDAAGLEIDQMVVTFRAGEFVAGRAISNRCRMINFRFSNNLTVR